MSKTSDSLPHMARKEIDKLQEKRIPKSLTESTRLMILLLIL